MIATKKILALPGFLGKPADFSFLKPSFFYGLDLTRINLKSFDHAAVDILNFSEREKLIGLGYSLGGRLLLHAVAKNPNAYHAAIFICTHPGLRNKEEKIKRYENDFIWKEKFLFDPWEKNISDWNEQTIFAHSKKIAPSKDKFSASYLKSCLLNLSLSKQKNFSAEIFKFSIPCLWFCPINEKEKLGNLNLAHERSKVIFFDGGHRLILDDPKFLRNEIMKFLLSLKE